MTMQFLFASQVLNLSVRVNSHLLSKYYDIIGRHLNFFYNLLVIKSESVIDFKIF